MKEPIGRSGVANITVFPTKISLYLGERRTNEPRYMYLQLTSFENSRVNGR